MIDQAKKDKKRNTHTIQQTDTDWEKTNTFNKIKKRQQEKSQCNLREMKGWSHPKWLWLRLKKKESGEEVTIKFTVEKIKSTVEHLGTIKLINFIVFFKKSTN